MTYTQHLSALAVRLLSPGERAALRRLGTEFRISRHHREGLRRMSACLGRARRSLI